MNQKSQSKSHLFRLATEYSDPTLCVALAKQRIRKVLLNCNGLLLLSVAQLTSLSSASVEKVVKLWHYMSSTVGKRL